MATPSVNLQVTYEELSVTCNGGVVLVPNHFTGHPMVQLTGPDGRVYGADVWNLGTQFQLNLQGYAPDGTVMTASVVGNKLIPVSTGV